MQAKLVGMVLGIDLGSSAARAVAMSPESYEILAVGVAPYPSGTDGIITDASDPDIARQAPADYVLALAQAVRQALAKAHGPLIAAIGVCATGSTPVPVAADLRPLGDLADFQNVPEAQAWMWKDHSAACEAEELVAALTSHTPGRLAATGGTTSSEWFWAKLLKLLRSNPDVGAATAAFVELQDLIPAILCDVKAVNELVRGTCAAGHKGHWDPTFGGWPAQTVLSRLHHRLASAAGPLSMPRPHGEVAGWLSPDWAGRLGLHPGIPVSVGLLDAHAGALAAGVAPGRLVRIMGTSSCDIAVVDGAAKDIPANGLAGAIDGSVLPGFAGIEAGQAAVGDLFAWAAKLLCPQQPVSAAIASLSAEAARLSPGESGLLALDWNNGNRSVLMDPTLSGLMIGQTLSTSPAHVFRAILEASAFGARRIRDQMVASGIPISSVTVSGGVIERNPLARQLLADVLAVPIAVSGADQASARGAAMAAAVVGGFHPDFTSAQTAMVPPAAETAQPDPARADVYDRLYCHYRRLHDAFGSGHSPLGGIMRDLRAIRQEVGTLPEETTA